MEVIKYKSFKIQIFLDETFSPDSIDKKQKYSSQYLCAERPTTKIGIRLIPIADAHNTIASAIITNSGGATGVHPNCYLAVNDQLLVCVSDSVYCLNLPNLNLLWRSQADSATCFGIYKVADGYIVHGELQISKLDSGGNILWQHGGKDIFTSATGKNDFKIENGIVIVRDWDNNIYRITLDGKLS